MNTLRSWFAFGHLLDLLHSGFSSLIAKKKSILQGVVGLMMLSGIVWGCITHDFKKGWELYIREIDFTFKPLFEGAMKRGQLFSRYVFTPMLIAYLEASQSAFNEVSNESVK